MRGKVCIIGEGTERIDCRMDEDAGNQTPAAIKKRNQQEADRNGKDDLAQAAHKIHSAAIEQIDDMPDAEGQAGNDDGRFHIVFCNGRKQQTPEDHFLQESNTEHTHDAAGRFRWCVIDRSAVPEVS